MAPRLISLVLVILLVLVVVESAPRAKKVRCKDKRNYHYCYTNKTIRCPQECLRTCVVDCSICKPVCTRPPPPPPSPPPPPPRQRRRRSPPPPPITSSPLPPPPSGGLPSPPSPPSELPFPPPPPTEVAGRRRVRCRNRNFSDCNWIEMYCPSDCPNQCEVDCTICSPVCNCNRPGAVCQDPRFVGGDGITFYFHGHKGRDFCILADSNLHINAHFIGKRNAGMKRDFTWVQSLGILFDRHNLFVGARKTATWDDSFDRLSLSFNGIPVFLPTHDGATWLSTSSPPLTITRTSITNAVEIEVPGNFKIKAVVVPITEKESLVHNYGITPEDCFAHLDLSFKFFSLSSDVNGVLGQTYARDYVSRVKMGVAMPVLGGDKEFSSSSLFATDCAVAKFKGHFNGVLNYSESLEHADMNCAGAMDSGGVVCKR